jgi:pyruvate,water dikinase
MDAPSPDSDARPGHPAWRKAWRGFLTFLEIIGLKDESREVDQAAQLARFKLYHTEFRKLLTANNSFLENLAEMDERRTGRGFVDQAYVQRKVVRAVADAHAMVDGLQVVSGGRYPALRDALARITAELDALCQGDACGGPAALVLDAGDIRASHADLVGGKMSNLGELRNALGLPTPDGFAVTTEAYRLLVEQGGLRSWIQTEHMALDSADAIEGVSAELLEGIRATALPEPLQAELDQALARLTERMGGPVHLAVRSSALGEDSALSFAGQFKSLLNVAPAELPEAYREVAASLYTPEAIHYRMLHGVAGDSAEMAVGVIAMQDATASGVVFSRDPSAPDAGEVLIQSVHGLGVSLVDGRTSPEVIRVAREGDPPRLTRTASRQASRFVALPGSGIKEDTLDPAAAAIPCITDEEALQLARWALELEAHFGCPQDIEWSVTPDRRLVLLQSRPLRVLRQAARQAPEPGFPLLFEGGETACPGVGWGPAVHLDGDGEIESFPEGGVLVARRSSPSLVRVMSKARAIVTDAGSTTGHMASLARELRIPTLLNTGMATRAISADTLVTVDAGNRHVYAGEVRPLIERQSAVAEVETAHSERRRTPEILFLERALEQIAPLNLSDPLAPTFTAENCRTLHDLARFIHEKSYAEMFGLGTEMGDLRTASYQLDVFLPIDLFIIDLGGGVNAPPKGRMVKPARVVSVPMAAVLAGMLDTRIPRSGPRPIDARGLLSVMMRHATTSPEAGESFQAPCYALVSDCYVNYSARVGYHFSVLDAYCSPTRNKNYINLLFRGGAADQQRRGRRTRAIAHILKHHGFATQLNADIVIGRLNKGTLEETRTQLEMIGRLLQFFRQMDAAMASDDHMRMIQEAFLAGDYGMTGAAGPDAAPAAT